MTGLAIRLCAMMLVALAAGCAPSAPTGPEATAEGTRVAGSAPTADSKATAAVATVTPPGTAEASPVAAGHEVNGNDLLAPVNRQNSLAAGFTPNDLTDVPTTLAIRAGIRLRKATLNAAQAMAMEAQAEGLRLVVISGFRSFQEQEALYQGYVAQMGHEQASRISAVPGHSEHQLGTAIDFSSPSAGYQLEESFGGTGEGKWLLQHAGQFGFVPSYPQGREAVTGYAYEPWHYRYVGVEHARAVTASGLTSTEYLNER